MGERERRERERERETERRKIEKLRDRKNINTYNMITTLSKEPTTLSLTFPALTLYVASAKFELWTDESR